MTKEQACIKEMYKILDKIETDAKHRDFTLLRIHRGASGCDMFQGTPPITRIMASLLNKYNDVICQAMKENDKETYE